MPITLDNLSPDETIPARSRTFAPEVVKRVHEYLTGSGEGIEKPAANLAVGLFDAEGKARSALHTLNRLLREQHGHTKNYAGTVRQTEDGKFKAIIVNKPAKVKKDKSTTPAPASRSRAA